MNGKRIGEIQTELKQFNKRYVTNDVYKHLIIKRQMLHEDNDETDIKAKIYIRCYLHTSCCIF